MFVSINLCQFQLELDLLYPPYIQECKKIIEERNLTHKLESNGTAIKGDGKVVFKCVENAMQKAIKKVTQGYLVISN